MARLDPDSIPNFVLLQLIHSGAHVEVWLARDSLTGVHRAIKVIWFEPDPPTPTDPNRDHRAEAEDLLRGLEAYLKRVRSDHPPALPILAVHRHPSGRFFYYVMPIADDATPQGSPGTPGFDSYQPLTLDVLRRRQPNHRLAPDVVVRIGVRLASGLAELHAAGLVHRDIRPCNIVFLNGEPTFANIDLAPDIHAALTIAATEGYIPPEGAGRPTADVYSLTMTLFVLLTGSPALRFPSLPPDWQSIATDRLALELNEIFNRGGHPNPAQRYPDAAHLREDLLHLEAGRSLSRFRSLKRLWK